MTLRSTTVQKNKNLIVFFHSLSGGLSLAVEGPSKAEITCKDNKDGTCTVSYMPTAPGDYNIIVKFDNKHISGSPFTAKITGEEINHFSHRLSYFTVDSYLFIVGCVQHKS